MKMFSGVNQACGIFDTERFFLKIKRLSGNFEKKRE